MAKNRILTIQEVWNASVSLSKKPEEIKVRDYISPSDLGKPFIDRYYKMKGEPYSNDYDERVLRIFDAGRLFEWVVLRSLAMAGVLKSRGSRVKKNYVTVPERKGCLRVWGYYDGLMGGIANWDEARGRIQRWLEEFKLELDDEVIERYSMKLIKGLEEKFGNKEIPETIIEVKSVNSMAFWGAKNRDGNGNFLGYEHHDLQTYAYLIGTGSEKPTPTEAGRIFYISKDDLTLQENGIFLNDAKIEKRFWEDIEKMSYYYQNNIVPPKEPEIVFDDRKGVFTTNWQVGRSVYLTKIYGYKDQEAFETKNHQKILDINRALKHLKEGKVKTEDEAVIKEWQLEKYK